MGLEKSYAATNIQTSFFLYDKMNEDKQFTISLEYKFVGNLSLNKLEWVLRTLRSRHDVLRTGFSIQDDQVFAEVHDVDDLNNKVYRIFEDKSLKDTELDLNIGECINFTVLDKGKAVFLMIKIHHVCVDELSINILLKEIMALYNNSNLVDIQSSYSQSVIENKNVRGNKSGTYFQSTHLNSEMVYKLEGSGTQKLCNLSSKKGYSRFTVLSSLLDIVLRRTVVNFDEQIGTTINTRFKNGDFSSIGPFIKNEAFTPIDFEQTSFVDALKNRQKNIIDLMQSNLSKFNAKILINGVLNNDAVHILHLGNCTLNLMNSKDKQISSYDLVINVSLDKWKIDVLYNPGFLLEKEITTLLDNMDYLAINILEQPNVLISKLSMLQKGDCISNYISSNKRLVDFDCNNVPQAFYEIAQKFPEKSAIVDGVSSITYGELLEKSRIVASNINKLTGQKGVIAFSGHRQIESWILVFGILLSGNAFMYLDINDPKKLQQQKIEMVKPILNITSEVMTKILKEHYVDDDFDIKNIKLSDLAYVTFTSGTTGMPKGIMIEQHSLLNLNEYMKKQLKVSSTDRVIQYSEIRFDGFIWESTMALLNGATLYIFPDKDKYSPKIVAKYIEQNRITCAAFPAAIVSLYNPQGLRLLVVSGSAMPASVLGNTSSIDIAVNSYGPSECTVAATGWDFTNASENKISIGKSILNTKTIILTENNNMCAPFESGQLVITGENVGRGYVDGHIRGFKKISADGLDIPAFFTGDIGYYDCDGNIILEGRKDSQVKVNGHRIELMEIQNFTQSLTGISNCSVILDDHSKIVMAYSSDMGISDEEIKDTLRKSLEEYKIPNFILKMKNVPLNSSGKVDRDSILKALAENKNLANIDVTLDDNHIVFIESIKELLKVSQIDPRLSFIDNGGTSIDAIRLKSLLKKETLAVKIADLLGNTTLIDVQIKKILKIKKQSLGCEKVINNTEVMEQFFSGRFSPHAYFNQVQLISLKNVSYNQVKKAIKKVYEKHDVLHAKIDKDTLRVTDNEIVNLEIMHVETENVNLKEIYLNHIRDKQGTDDLKFQILIVDDLTGESKLLWSVSHLLVDMSSWDVMLRELDGALSDQAIESSHQFGTWSATRVNTNGVVKNGIFNQSHEYTKTSFSIPQTTKNVELDSVYDRITKALTLVFGAEFVKNRIFVEKNMRNDDYLELYDTVGWFTREVPLQTEQEEKVDLHGNRIIVNYLGAYENRKMEYSNFEVIQNQFQDEMQYLTNELIVINCVLSNHEFKFNIDFAEDVISKNNLTDFKSQLIAAF